MDVSLDVKRRGNSVEVSAVAKVAGRKLKLASVTVAAEDGCVTKKAKSGPVRCNFSVCFDGQRLCLKAKAYVKTPFGKKTLGKAEKCVSL